MELLRSFLLLALLLAHITVSASSCVDVKERMITGECKNTEVAVRTKADKLSGKIGVAAGWTKKSSLTNATVEFGPCKFGFGLQDLDGASAFSIGDNSFGKSLTFTATAARIYFYNPKGMPLMNQSCTLDFKQPESTFTVSMKLSAEDKDLFIQFDEPAVLLDVSEAEGPSYTWVWIVLSILSVLFGGLVVGLLFYFLPCIRLKAFFRRKLASNPGKSKDIETGCYGRKKKTSKHEPKEKSEDSVPPAAIPLDATQDATRTVDPLASMTARSGASQSGPTVNQPTSVTARSPSRSATQLASMTARSSSRTAASTAEPTPVTAANLEDRNKRLATLQKRLTVMRKRFEERFQIKFAHYKETLHHQHMTLAELDQAIAEAELFADQLDVAERFIDAEIARGAVIVNTLQKQEQSLMERLARCCGRCWSSSQDAGDAIPLDNTQSDRSAKRESSLDDTQSGSTKTAKEDAKPANE